MQFQVVFHVNEQNESGAQEWLRRVTAILNAYKSELVSPTQQVDGEPVGSHCPGHVLAATEEKSPAKVLEMGPRG